MNFDRCIKVEDVPTIFMVRDDSKSKVPVKHWEDYAALGQPIFETVTQEDADRLRTVEFFGQHRGANVDKPMVLVTIPTLNRPKMCRRAVASLMHQKSPNWNLVIAKNGGSFHTPDYITALSDVLDHPKVRFLVLPKRGLGYALNEVFHHFNGGHRYFANLEDDDEWGENFLTTMIKTLEESGADVAHCQQRQNPKPIQSNGEPMDTDMLKRHNWINFPMCLFRTELVRKVDGFCNAAGPATDWDFHLRAVQAGARYVFVNQPLVTHHWHDSNYCITHKRGGSMYVKEQIKGGHYD